MSKKNKEEYIQNPELLKEYLDKGQYRFLVDNMLQKLALGLRNIGIDTAFVGDDIKSNKDKIKLAEEQERIILTKSKQIMLTKKVCPLIKITGGKTDEQLRQIIKKCNIKIDKSKILGRCGKCNNPELLSISIEEAMEHLKWESTEGQEDVKFYRCSKCLQIFWEGGMFERAKKKFNAIGEWSLELPQSNKPILEGKKSKKAKQAQPETEDPNPTPGGPSEGEEKTPVNGTEGHDTRINLGAVNLTNIIDLVKSDVMTQVNKNMDSLRTQIKAEVIAELMENYELVPRKKEESTVVENSSGDVVGTEEVTVEKVTE